MNSAIFITVRMGSTRLPGKALLTINGKPTIEYLIERVQRSKRAGSIILCTTELREDDVLCEIAKRNNILFFRGSVEDKLARWRGAARLYQVEFFVTADGDDLFCEPELIDLAFEQYQRSHADFIEAPRVICGAFTYGVKTEALEKVCEIKDTDDTEMMWVYFKDTGLFNVEELKGVDPIFERSDIRMTLDYEDDLTFFKTIIGYFEKVKREFDLRDIIHFLDAHPEVIKINQHLMSEWAENQAKRTKLIIKSVP